MARLTYEELEKVKKEYGVSRLYSWSRVNCFMTSMWEYYLKYVLKKKEDRLDCIYAPCGGACHEILEDLYEGRIEYDEMPERFDNSWFICREASELKFDRNDIVKDESISNKYKVNLEHFFKHHKKIEDKILIEKFATAKIGDYVLQGYIDALVINPDKTVTIIDWKTSSKYSGKTAEEKCGQLVVYAIALTQKGIPLEKISICWNFLKYATIKYQQKNGAVKTRDVDRYKIGESLQANVKMWLKTLDLSDDEVNDYLKRMIDTNGIECLPEEVRDKYEINDCYVYVPLTQKLIDKWVKTITLTIQDIELREQDYETSNNYRVFWDSEESVKEQSYYLSTLCSYSASLHLPYKEYLEKLEKQKQGIDLFCGVGNDTDSDDSGYAYNSASTDKDVCSNNDLDLSWLDELM